MAVAHRIEDLIEFSNIQVAGVAVAVLVEVVLVELGVVVGEDGEVEGRQRDHFLLQNAVLNVLGLYKGIFPLL